MKTIAHFSDTHGLPRKHVPDETDVIVISGDIAPDRGPNQFDHNRAYQEDWYRKTVSHWRKWSRGCPVVFVQGNHDYYSPEAVFRANGIEAVEVTGTKLTDVRGILFAGLPHIPHMGGFHSHEVEEAELQSCMERLLSLRPDVVVAHAPIYGILDDPFELDKTYRIGSKGYQNAFEKTANEDLPIALLHGHCHERGGRVVAYRDRMEVSNAATKRNMIYHGTFRRRSL